MKENEISIRIKILNIKDVIRVMSRISSIKTPLYHEYLKAIKQELLEYEIRYKKLIEKE